jgi:hypothetical protein
MVRSVEFETFSKHDANVTSVVSVIQQSGLMSVMYL